jgi:two-component system sensor histidine kinase QseC
VKAVSLRAQLRWLIIALVLAVLLPLGIFSYQRTLSEVDELLDGRLAESAHTLALLIRHAGVDSLESPRGVAVTSATPLRRAGMVSVQGRTYESEVGLQVSDMAGRMKLVTANLARLLPPQRDDLGFHDLVHEGHRWRMFALADAPDGVLIRVGERYDSRHDIIQALWIEHGVPLLLGLPLLAVLIGWAVRRGLRPLESLTRALAARAPGSRQPIALGVVPQELKPVIEAMNGQFERLEDALERERRFSADVAHELRTPLAAMMIHLESVALAADQAEREVSLTSARHGLSNLARRVEQLLALARLEAGAASQQRARVDLVVVAMDMIDELAPMIADSGVSLSLTRVSPTLVVLGNEAALAALLRNLIENALRHVPAGGQVEVCLSSDARNALIDVIDDGPGIPLALREKVFARFQRAGAGSSDGYGLGLSIVQRAAQLHGATIELLDAPHGPGLRVRVAIPLTGMDG